MPPTGSHKVIVFAKAPRPGTVKTRLMPVLGAEGAAALHARLVEHTLAVASAAAPRALELHGDPADDHFLRYCSTRYGATLIPQQGQNLGERMQHAFEHAFLRENHAAAVLIGTDCPALTARLLRAALRVLTQGEDAVFVPAEDGGYALVGLARYDRRLFEDIPWSTERVLSQTRAHLRAFGWRWVELETLWDVDRPSDITRLNESRLLERETAPHFTLTPTTSGFDPA